MSVWLPPEEAKVEYAKSQLLLNDEYRSICTSWSVGEEWLL